MTRVLFVLFIFLGLSTLARAQMNSASNPASPIGAGTLTIIMNGSASRHHAPSKAQQEEERKKAFAQEKQRAEHFFRANFANESAYAMREHMTEGCYLFGRKNALELDNVMVCKNTNAFVVHKAQ